MDIGKIVPAALRRAGVCCPLRGDQKHKIRNSQENYLPQLQFFLKKYFADILRKNKPYLQPDFLTKTTLVASESPTDITLLPYFNCVT
jgi:hypothetical protein